MGIRDMLHRVMRKKPKQHMVFAAKGVAPAPGTRTLKGLQEKRGKGVEEFHALAKAERHEDWRHAAEVQKAAKALRKMHGHGTAKLRPGARQRAKRIRKKAA